MLLRHHKESRPLSHQHKTLLPRALRTHRVTHSLYISEQFLARESGVAQKEQHTAF